MDRLPTSFGPYTLLRSLGQGGMAQAYLAWRQGSEGIDHYVCIKTILKTHHHSDYFVRHFEREAKLISRLRHANITQLLEFGTVDGQKFLALELIDGLDLGKLLTRIRAKHHALPSELVHYIAVQVTYALECAHRARFRDRDTPILHRDISPSNIFIGCNGNVKLGDFGIAKTLDVGATILTEDLQAKGKTPYMAPEYMRGEPFTPQADLYSLGVTLYELLAGVRPFDAQRTVQIFEKASQGLFTPLSDAAPHAAKPLATIVETLIAANPAHRFASTTALLDALSAMPMSVLAPRELGQLVEAYQLADEKLRYAGPAESNAHDGLGTFEAGAEEGVESHTQSTLKDIVEGHRTKVDRPHADITTAGKPIIPSRRKGAKLALLAASVSLLMLGSVAFYKRQQHDRTDIQANSVSVATARAPDSTRNQPADTTLTVVVIPTGEVFIDGHAQGNSPVTATLTPGQHVIRAEHATQQTEQRVALEPGQTKRVVLRLDLAR